MSSEAPPEPAATGGAAQHPFVRALPGGDEYTSLLAPPQSATMRSGLVTLRPGQDCGRHSTEQYEEMLVCLAGEGQVEVEGFGRLRFAGGQVAYLPPQTFHNVHNCGSDAMRYIYIVAAASP